MADTALQVGGVLVAVRATGRVWVRILDLLGAGDVVGGWRPAHTTGG
jgi:hypothetical protein